MRHPADGVELFGGVLLALGFLTPIAAALVVAQSVYIVLRVHLPRGFWSKNGGIEFPLQLLAGSLLIVATGPGAIAIDPAITLDFAVWWRAVFLVVAVVSALVAMAIARPLPQGQSSRRRRHADPESIQRKDPPSARRGGSLVSAYIHAVNFEPARLARRAILRTCDKRQGAEGIWKACSRAGVATSTSRHYHDAAVGRAFRDDAR